MDWQLHDARRRARLLVLVSKQGHCLNDLLFRAHSRQLKVDIAAVASNHADFAALAGSYGVPFHHLPVSVDNRAQQERQILDLVARENIDLVVLARYMQILSPQLCAALAGRAINIHHSFLPSFKGAQPYHQAHARGVKIIGATAHYVTCDLDEGPIIEQDVARVAHAMTPRDLVRLGSDTESLVLARAVRRHVEHRILLNGHRTVVFRYKGPLPSPPRGLGGMAATICQWHCGIAWANSCNGWCNCRLTCSRSNSGWTNTRTAAWRCSATSACLGWARSRPRRCAPVLVPKRNTPITLPACEAV